MLNTPTTDPFLESQFPFIELNSDGLVYVLRVTDQFLYPSVRSHSAPRDIPSAIN